MVFYSFLKNPKPLLDGKDTLSAADITVLAGMEG